MRGVGGVRSAAVNADARAAFGRAFVAVRQAMPHVEQRFLMHRLVFERGERALGAIEHGMTGTIDGGVTQRLDHHVVGGARVGLHGLA